MLELELKGIEQNDRLDTETGEVVGWKKLYFSNAKGGFFAIWTRSKKDMQIGDLVKLNIITNKDGYPSIVVAE